MRMTIAGGAAVEVGRWPRCVNTSSTTAAGGETSKRYYQGSGKGTGLEGRQKQTPADLCTLIHIGLRPSNDGLRNGYGS